MGHSSAIVHIGAAVLAALLFSPVSHAADRSTPDNTVAALWRAMSHEAGVATDTGQFRFPSTTQRVFDLTSRLIAAGADPAAASFELYERESFAKIALLGRFLESFRRECGGRVCVGFLRRDDFTATGATSEDTEGLVDYARSIEGVDVGVLIEERPASLRPGPIVDQQGHELGQHAGLPLYTIGQRRGLGIAAARRRAARRGTRARSCGPPGRATRSRTCAASDRRVEPRPSGRAAGRPA